MVWLCIFRRIAFLTYYELKSPLVLEVKNLRTTFPFNSAQGSHDLTDLFWILGDRKADLLPLVYLNSCFDNLLLLYMFNVLLPEFLLYYGLPLFLVIPLFFSEKWCLKFVFHGCLWYLPFEDLSDAKMMFICTCSALLPEKESQEEKSVEKNIWEMKFSQYKTIYLGTLCESNLAYFLRKGDEKSSCIY